MKTNGPPPRPFISGEGAVSIAVGIVVATVLVMMVMSMRSCSIRELAERDAKVLLEAEQTITVKPHQPRFIEIVYAATEKEIDGKVYRLKEKRHLIDASRVVSVEYDNIGELRVKHTRPSDDWTLHNDFRGVSFEMWIEAASQLESPNIFDVTAEPEDD